MRTALDTNVISALWSAEPLADRIANVLGEANDEGGLVISPPVFAELFAHPKATQKQIEKFLSVTAITVDFDLDERVWAETGHRYARYVKRRRGSQGGESRRLLADFIVGAHALVQADRLLTLDQGRYHRDFPELELFSI